jgi:prepilin-type N-terminal cleavage/methylation domain-containing protein
VKVHNFRGAKIVHVVFHEKKGFTLLELFMVLAVLAIISTVAVSYYRDYIEDAKIAVRKTNEKLLNEALNRYYKEHMAYPKYVWRNDTEEDLDKKIFKGLDIALGTSFVDRLPSEIISESIDSKGYNIYFRVTQPPKNDGIISDNSFSAGSWKQAHNMRVETRDYLVNEIRILPSDSGFQTSTFDDNETFVFPVISNYEPIENSEGYNMIEPNDELDIKMVACPPGTFKMGAAPDEPVSKTNENQHTVTLTKQFLIGKYEVTQKQYQEVMGTNPSNNKSGPMYPVEKVNREDALLFCEKLNTLYSKLVPYGYKFDLPTEAQWEYACRAGTETSLNNGTHITKAKAFCPNLDKVGWFKYNAGDPPKIDQNPHTHPVGLKDPNAWGIYDMHGNVEELVKDYRTVVGSDWGHYPGGDEVDPYVASGNQQSYRGGGYSIDPERCRSASRQGSIPSNKPATVGFRVVLVEK